MAKQIDVDFLVRKYREERDKRLQRGERTSIDPLKTGLFPGFERDPWITEEIERAPLIEDVDVLMTGAGLGGEVTAVKLIERGVTNIRLIDVAGDFGGVWYWQRYPGVRCDIESYIYMPLLEEVGFMPKEKFATGPEIRELAQTIGRHYGLYDKALFQTKITEARWDEDSHRWHVTTNRGDLIRTRFLIGASGFLHYPKFPNVRGIADFKGKLIHPSRWDIDYMGGGPDGNLTGLKGKRVALMGTGATAIQILPHLFQHADQVFMIQRTPAAVGERNNRPTDVEWYKNQAPGWQMERMRNWHAVLSGQPYDVDLVNDCFTKSAGALNRAAQSAASMEEAMEAVQRVDYELQEATRSLTKRVVKDPETAEKLKGWYNFWCKRPVFADDYLQSFNEPNVELVDTDGHGLEAFTETGFIANGRHFEVDCFIMCSGYEIGAYDKKSATFPTIGRGGVTLADHWDNGIHSVHGMYTYNFPNYQIVGAVAQAGATLNYMWLVVEQAIHAAEIISRALKEDIATFEVTPEAEARWNEVLQSVKIDTRKFAESCTPGYINSEGNLEKPGPYMQSYDRGAIAFFDLLRAWRSGGYKEDTTITFNSQLQKH